MLNGTVSGALICGFHIISVPVYDEELFAANLYESLIYTTFHLGRCGNSEVAVTEDIVAGDSGKLLHGGEKIAYPVSEEEYMVNPARVLVQTDIVSDIFGVAVGIGKNKNLHKHSCE